MKRIIIYLLALATVFTLVSCAEKDTFRVTFNSNGGSAVDDVTVVDGGTIDEVIENSKTIREGYAFRGWYSDKDCKNLWVSGTAIKGNTTVYAGWDNAFVSFTSTGAFSVTPNGTWAVSEDNIIEYSYDGYDWTSVTAGEPVSVSEQIEGFNSFAVYFRGSNNTVVTGASGNAWAVSSTASPASGIYCNGDIRALLEHEAVYDPSYEDYKCITVGTSAFEGMFMGQPILSAPYIEKAVSGEDKYMENMFNGCSNLTVSKTKPESGSYQVFTCTEYHPENFYKNMFKVTTDVLPCDTPSTGFTYYIY